MELNRGSGATTGRVLVVVDWTTDPEAVVAACVKRAELTGGDFACSCRPGCMGSTGRATLPQAFRAPTGSSPRLAATPTPLASRFTPRASAAPTP
jgi:hypothetical protein